MKRMILFLCLTAVLLAGCSREAVPAVTEAPTEAVTEATTEPTTEAPAETAVPETVPRLAEPDLVLDCAPFTVPQQVIFDQYDLKITTGEYGFDEYMGFYVDLIFDSYGENSFSFWGGDFAVNGCMTGWDTINMGASSGETCTYRIYPTHQYDYETLAATGVRHIGQILYLPTIYMDTGSSGEEFSCVPITIRTSDASVMETPALPEGVLCVDEDSLQITATRQNTKEAFGDDIHVLVTNKTDRAFDLSTRILSVDNIPEDSFSWVRDNDGFPHIMVLPGTSRLFKIDLIPASAEYAWIHDAEEIEIAFSAYDLDDRSIVYESEEPILLK